MPDEQRPEDDAWLDAQPDEEPSGPPEAESGPQTRTIDAAAWAARGIVVATLGLLALVGGLVLGVSVGDSASSTAIPSSPAATTSTASNSTLVEEVAARRPAAPPVKVSPAAVLPSPASTAARPGAGSTSSTRPVATSTSTAPASTTSSPTSTATPHGKGSNSTKPKPTKP